MKKQIIFSAAIFLITAANAEPNGMLAKNDPQSYMSTSSGIKSGTREEKREMRKATRNSDVSYFSTLQFNVDFGNIPVDSWTRVGDMDMATFTQNGQMTSAFYDENAQLIGTTSKKTFSDLPLKARERINKKYSDYTVGDIIFYDDNEDNESDMSIYDTPYNGEDSYFVELKKDNKAIVLHVDEDGDIPYFLNLK